MSIFSIQYNKYISCFRLKVEKGLFSQSGELKIKCTATIDPIYWKSNEESIQGLLERSYINFWNSGNLTQLERYTATLIIWREKSKAIISKVINLLKERNSL